MGIFPCLASNDTRAKHAVATGVSPEERSALAQCPGEWGGQRIPTAQRDPHSPAFSSASPAGAAPRTLLSTGRGSGPWASPAPRDNSAAQLVPRGCSEEGELCKHCLHTETQPLGEAPGGAICASLQRCEWSEGAARLGFTDGKPPGRQGKGAVVLPSGSNLLSSSKGHFWALKNLGSGFMGGWERRQPRVRSHTSLPSLSLKFQKDSGCKIMSCQMEAKI